MSSSHFQAKSAACLTAELLEALGGIQYFSISAFSFPLFVLQPTLFPHE